MHEHPLKSSLAQARKITLWFCLLLGLGLSACDRDVVTIEGLGRQPAQNAEIAPGNIQFSWVSNGTGDSHQGVGNGSYTQIDFTTH
jgi:hypothetical protein